MIGATTTGRTTSAISESCNADCDSHTDACSGSAYHPTERSPDCDCVAHSKATGKPHHCCCKACRTARCRASGCTVPHPHASTRATTAS
jgi:hypothetical protein